MAKCRLGAQACGHPQIAHGGAIAALLDDVFGAAFFAAKLGVGFTANLSVQYRQPLPAGTEVVIRAEIDRVEESARSGAKKVFLRGSVVSASDRSKVYSEGTALFIVKQLPVSTKLMAAVHSAIATAGGGKPLG